MLNYAFPDDLLQSQRAWHAAYRQLADPHCAHTTALRRDLHRLSAQIAAHPYWTSLAGASPAARVALRQRALYATG